MLQIAWPYGAPVCDVQDPDVPKIYTEAYDKVTMVDDSDDFEENLKSLKGYFVEYPDHDTVMDIVKSQGRVNSILRDSLNTPTPRSHIYELYEEAKNNPDLINEYPEIVELIPNIIIDRPGLNCKRTNALLLTILLQNSKNVTELEKFIPEMKKRFETIAQDLESILIQYWTEEGKSGTEIGGNILNQNIDLQKQGGENKYSAADLLDSMKYQAESLGYLVSACAYEYPTRIVPLTSKALELGQIEYREKEKLPEHPSVKNSTVSSKHCIIKMSDNFLTELGSSQLLGDDLNPGRIGAFGSGGRAIFSEEIPTGFLNQLVINHNKYVGLKSIKSKLVLAASLSESHVELIEPVIPEILEMLRAPQAVTTLSNLAEQKPELLLNYENELRQLMNVDKENDEKDYNTEMEFEREVSTIIRSISASELDNFWDFKHLWIDIIKSDQVSPQIKRDVIQLVKDYLQHGGRLDVGLELIELLADNPDWKVRKQVAEILKLNDGNSYQSTLQELANDPVPEVQKAATEALNQS